MSDNKAVQTPVQKYRRANDQEFALKQASLRREFRGKHSKRTVFWMLSNDHKIIIYPEACLDGCTYEVEVMDASSSTMVTDSPITFNYDPTDESTWEDTFTDVEANGEYLVKMCKTADKDPNAVVSPDKCEVWLCDTRTPAEVDSEGTTDNICEDKHETDFY